MPLTETAIRNAKPKEKPYKLYDKKGMFLLVNPNGGKYFRKKYRYAGKEKTLAIGVYSEVSLKEARDKAIEANRQISNGIDPSQHKQSLKQSYSISESNQFEFVAREWFLKNSPIWAPSHSSKIIRRLETFIFPYFSERDIASITAPELLAVLEKIEKLNKIETAHRVKQICGQVFRYAISTGRAERDISADLRGALTAYRSKNMATIIDPKEIGVLLRTIEGYKGGIVTLCALKLAPLLFVRPGELRRAEWKDIDLEKNIWKIPAENMKRNRTHIVPLSTQAMAILKELLPLTGKGKYVFPSVRTNVRSMSENTVNAAIRNLGYTKEEMTGHGFRAMASTLLHENGWPSHLIEMQLAHIEGNRVKAAYNHAQYLEERVKMMQWWSDYLDQLRLSC